MTNRDKINDLLKNADDALKLDIVDNGIVKDGYDSAIAAFGPTVVLSGLMPAMAFYCATNKTDKRKADKSLVIKAIALTLFQKYKKTDHKELFEHCLNHLNDEKLMADIVDASIALKIMVRTYKIEDSHE